MQRYEDFLKNEENMNKTFRKGALAKTKQRLEEFKLLAKKCFEGVSREKFPAKRCFERISREKLLAKRRFEEISREKLAARRRFEGIMSNEKMFRYSDIQIFRI